VVSGPDAACPLPPVAPAFSFQLSTFRISSVLVALAAWWVVVEAGNEWWYRSHEGRSSGNANWSLDAAGANSAFTQVEVPAGIRGQFRYDEGLEGRWRDGSGSVWQLYYFRWLPARSLRNRVAIQLGKSHGPEICLPAVGMRLKSDLGITTLRFGDFDLALRQYVFEVEGKPLHVFYGIYEDQTGGELANRRRTPASRVQAALAGSRNYGQRFLELAVFGYEKPEDARAALARELGSLIKVAPRQ